MMTRILFVAMLVAALAESPLPQSRTTDATLFPPSTVVYAELSDPLDLIYTTIFAVLRKIKALPPYKMAIQTPPYRANLSRRHGRGTIEHAFAQRRLRL